MKKFISFLLSGTILFALFSISTFAAGNVIDGVSYSSDGTQLLECTDRYSLGNVFTIPEGVEEICDGAFLDNNTITAVILPSTLKVIGNDAFRNSAVKDVDMSKCDNLKSILNSAFFGCKSLKSISLPTSVVSVADSVFRNCSDMEYLELPEIILPDNCLIGCTSLQRVAVKITEDNRMLYETGKITSGAEKVTAADARVVLRISAKLETALAYAIYSADVDRDGRITAADARKLLRVAANLETL